MTTFITMPHDRYHHNDPLTLSFFFFAPPWGLQYHHSRAQGRAKAHAVGVQSPNHSNREPQTPWNIQQSEDSWSSSYQHRDPALHNSLQTPVLEASGQTTSKTGTQSHQSKNKKIK